MVTEHLGNLFRVRSGDGISTANLSVLGTYPVYGGNGINGYTSEFNVEKETMVIGRVGEKCGNINITRSQSWVSDNALIVTPKTKYDLEYMSYLLEQINLNAYANRNAQPVISGKIIYAIETPYVEDIEKQGIIAQNLHSFDTYIDDLTELIEKKRGIRDGALDDLISGRNRLCSFEKRKIKTVPIYFLLKVKRGKRLVRAQLSERHSNSKFPVYQNSLSPLGYWQEYNCQAKSVFVIAAGNAGDIGFCNIAFWAADDCYYFEQCDAICQRYLYYALINQQQYIYAQTRRTSIPRLSRDILENMRIALYDIDEQEAIANTLTAMDEEIEALETERDKMIQIREGAMDDLLTGRVRLPIREV